MSCQWSSIRAGSLPTRSSDSWWTAVRTVAARPSTTGSPQPTTPSSVSTRHSSQRGGTAEGSTRVMMTDCSSGTGFQHAPAAVDHQRGSGDERGVIAEQEGDGPGHLLRASEAAGGGLLGTVAPVLLADAGPGAGEDGARQDGVDPYRGAVLDRQLAGQPGEPGLARRVGGAAGEPDERVHGRHQDRAPPGGPQAGEAGAEAEEGGGEADRQLPVPLVEAGPRR